MRCVARKTRGIRATCGALVIAIFGMLAARCAAEELPPFEQRVKALAIITGAGGQASPDFEKLRAAGKEREFRNPKHPFVAADLRRAVLNDRVIGALAAFPEIERLMLSKSGITDEQLAKLPLMNLKSLELGDTKISDEGIQSLWPLKKLEDLDLSRTAVTSRGLKTLATLGSLQSINLDETAIDDAGIAHLSKLPMLSGLRLNKTAVGDDALEHLRGATRLRQLGLHGTRVTDAGMVFLQDMANLSSLNVGETRVGDAGIEAIERLPDIQELGLSETRITDASAASIARWKNLAMLDLSGTLISDVGVERLRGLKKLVWLKLEVTQITDAALQSLTGMHKLEWLSLADTPITDAGLTHLQNLVSLRHLNVSGTQISDPRLQAVKDVPLTSLDVSRTQITSLDVFRAMPRRQNSVRLLFAALDEKTELDFKAQPLSDVLDYLRQRHNIEIQLDHRSLVDAGVAADTPITLSVKGATLREALEKLLDPLKLTFDVRHEVLFIAAKPLGKVEYDFPVVPAGQRLSPKLAETFMQQTEIDVAEAPLAEMVRLLAGKHQVTIELDPTSLTAAGIGSDVPITRTLKGITLKSALELMFAELELICVAEGEKVVIRTKPQK